MPHASFKEQDFPMVFPSQQYYTKQIVPIGILTKPLLFCLEIWGTDYEKIKETCLMAEDLGYHGYYYGESLAGIDLDCWTVISSLASLTKRIKLGPVITYLFPEYRNISLIAKQVSTFQDISGGRLELRTGAGATLQYATEWWHPYGIDYPVAKERVSIVEEALELLQMLLGVKSKKRTAAAAAEEEEDKKESAKSIYFNGRYFKANGVSPHRPKTSIPITIAAMKSKMLRVAAKNADTWESSFLTPMQFKKMNSKFDLILAGTDRNTEKKINKSIELDVIIAKSEQDLEYKRRVFSIERGPQVFNQALKHGLVGKPETIIERINEYADAGVNQFLLAFQDPFDSNSLEMFSDAIRKTG
ncbi:MAG: LLM class flavin-dependent oxidoreductase [Thermoproteota archaeon]|nr:LLM class flavin-dependent oxidoreductase [Thermoproteota archaeon]